MTAYMETLWISSMERKVSSLSVINPGLSFSHLLGCKSL